MSSIETVFDKIISDDEILEDVEIHIEHTVDHRSIRRWYGSFSYQGFIKDDFNRVILKDGRKGDIIITRVSSGTSGNHAQFNVSGALE
jgi:hypothetical protein